MRLSISVFKNRIKNNISLCVGLFIGLAVAYFVNYLNHAEVALTFLLLAMILFLCCVPLLVSFMAGRKLRDADPFEPVIAFSVLSFFYFVLGPISSIILKDYNIVGLEYLNREESIMALNNTMVFIATGMLLFYAGYYWNIPSAIAKSIPNISINWNKSRLILVLVASVLAGIISLTAIVIAFHGLPLLSGFSRTEIASSNLKYMLGLLLILKVALYVVFLDYLQVQSSSRAKTFLMFFFICFVLFVFGSIGSRTRTFTTLIVIACIYHYARKNLRLKTMVIVGTILLSTAVFLFPLINIIYSASMIAESRFAGKEVDVATILESQKMMFYDKVPLIAILLKNIPDKLDLQWGKTLPAFLSSFLPDTGLLALPFKDENDLFMGTFFPEEFKRGVSYPISIYGVLFMNFHIAGLFGMAMFGIFWRSLYKYLKANIRNKFVILFYSINISYFFGFYGANLTHALKFYIVEVMLFIFLILFISGGVFKTAEIDFKK